MVRSLRILRHPARPYAVMDLDEDSADEPRYVAGHEGRQDPISYFVHDTSYSWCCETNLGVAIYFICHMRYPLGRCYLIHGRSFWNLTDPLQMP
jgi:hypothetical protein